MKSITINNFSGGLSDDVRESSSNTFVSNKNFDSTTYDHRLVPYGELEAEALSSGSITDSLISDLVRDTSGYLYIIGRTSSGTPTGTTVFVKDSGTNIAATYTSTATVGASFARRENTFVSYNSNLYWFDSNHNLKKLVLPSTTSTAGTSSMSSSWTNEVIPRPFIHPMDNILYCAVGQYLAKVDNVTYSNISSVILPNYQYASSLTNYGSYLAIATVPSYTGGNSIVYLWDRNTSLTTFSEIINWGEGSLMVLENIGGTLIGVSISDANYTYQSTYTTTKTKKITVRALSGNQPVIIKEIIVSSSISLKNYKCQVNGRLYFGCDNDDSLYVVYKNKQGRIIVSKDRYLNNGSVVTTLRGFNIIGDYLFVGFDTAGNTGNWYRTKVTSSHTFTSYYETNINPNMPVEDRSKKKQLKSISASKGSTTGTVTLQYSVDGSAYTSIGTTVSQLVNKMTNDYLGNPFEAGYEYQFKIASDAGAEPTELKYSYEILNEII
jgi:hypothetical protein